MRTMVLVPTYDEVENVERIVRAVREAVPAASVLVIDDASPDGTAEVAEAVGEELGQVDVLRRAGKDGLGNAYRAGFAHAIALGFDVLVTLDADSSHDPAVIPELLARIEEGADLVAGSRYVPGGSTPNWPLHRQVLSRYGNRYTCWVLGLALSDATSGFRAYRASVLEAIGYDTTRANGYAFMTELAFRIASAGGTVAEVPIVFRDRVRGTSKMSGQIIVESMLRVTWWGLREAVRPGARRARAARS
ncbi:polyprenol monophosphomannose synthase [Iamia majanohamensis]|uniref:Polyprenol monophosphomannose synthase n=1 Tax=Iamia majanohamensis TaxID=467976 RepID=A0AAF0BSC9_9ACTN|nr:polyprenol monophosphomannose synthase [Iamia majanohamensis]WCO65077.1 polyprenol monophosphomannose synthase [Iamia majanohamensis]